MHQDGTFRYFFGLEAPGLIGLIDAQTGSAAIYGIEPTDEQRIWEGPLSSLRELADASGLKDAGTLIDLSAALSAARRQGR